MRLIKTISIATVALIPCLISAQSVEFDKNNFSDKAALKEATDAIKAGDQEFSAGPDRYGAAIPYYLKANEFNPDNAELNLKLGVCYINSAQRSKALPFVEKAHALEPNVHPRIHYLLGVCYHLNMQWDKAIAQYEQHRVSVPPMFEGDEYYVDVQKLIDECNNGKALSTEQVSVELSNLGPSINSEEVDQGPLLSADGKRLFFTSRREGTTGGKRDKTTGDHYEDIYYSEKVNGQWSTPQNLGPPVNTERNDAVVGLSNNGRRMIIFRGDKRSGDLYEARRVGDMWGVPEKMNENINSKYHESSASFSFDDQWLYFVSERQEHNYGGLDIFRSRWNAETSAWGPAENLGDVINSKYDENGIFVHPDGKTIYFSSKGHNSIGGYDVFSSEMQDGKWTTPKNLGIPVNTPDDDLFFVISASGRQAYFSSVRSDGIGADDLYSLKFMTRRMPMLSAQEELLAGLNAMVSPLIEPKVTIDDKELALLHGYIKELKMLKGMEAYIEVMDLEDDELVARFMSDPETGEFLVALPSGKNYGVNVRAEGYLFHSENVNIPLGTGYVEYEQEITLKEIEVGNHVVLKNIFFDPDQYAVKKQSKSELDLLAKLLNDNPGIVMEISGHTDNTGSEEHNQKLSEDRANAVVEYLRGMGILTERMVAKGYGSSVPIADNSTNAGRAMNRRTEFKVIAK